MSIKQNNESNDHIEQHIIEAIREIKYGAVEVVIHNSKIVQVEKTEKTRFNQN